jgi:hypothetical protein
MPATSQQSAVDLLNEVANLLSEKNWRGDLQEGLRELATQLATPSAPELTVWYGPMPESNGRSNFTAILMRKGGDMANGHTIDRSEYPDRVRYEADRVRYLVGELPDKPCILDYDAEKHSGYEPPARVQSAPASPATVTAEQVQWRNIQKVVRELAAFCFGSAADPTYGSCYTALVNSLTAKDGVQVKLEPLTAAAGAGKHVATVVAGKLANRLEWVSDEAHESTPVGTKLYGSAAGAENASAQAESTQEPQRG